MEKLRLAYLNPKSARAFGYFVIPKLLLEHEAFDDLDYGTKILYSFILSRASLSMKNAEDFTDQGRVFIIYPGDQVEADMRCSNKTAIKMMKQLEEIGLIERKRRGQGKPSLIFVKDFSSVPFQSSKNYTSRNVKSTPQEVKNLHDQSCKFNTSIIRKKKPNNSNLDSINLSEAGIDNMEAGSAIDDVMDVMDKINALKESVLENVGYETLKANNCDDAVDDIVGLIVEVLSSTAPSIRVGNENKPATVVKDRFQSLRMAHIEYVLFSLESGAKKIKNPKSYLMTTLYNAPLTINASMKNTVKSWI